MKDYMIALGALAAPIVLPLVVEGARALSSKGYAHVYLNNGDRARVIAYENSTEVWTGMYPLCIRDSDNIDGPDFRRQTCFTRGKITELYGEVSEREHEIFNEALEKAKKVIGGKE